MLPGVAHHAAQRGKNLQQMFFPDEDRTAYLDRMFICRALYCVKVLAYCMMPDDVHIVVVKRGGR